MEWTKPTFAEISLSGEVTAYANTDTTVQPVSAECEQPSPKVDRPDSE